MKYIIGKHIVLGLLAVALVFLTGCQSDSGDTIDTPRQNPTMQMQAYATTYKDAIPTASTRTDEEDEEGRWWPTGFELYTEHDAFRLAFTQGSSIVKGWDTNTNNFSDKDAKGVFSYQAGKWGSSFFLPTNGSYYLYGFMSNEGTLEDILPVSEDFANGATLTMKGLPTATSSDICVIVGVKKGLVTGKNSDNSDIVEISDVKMGQFGYTISDGKNHVYLLCDHIYAALGLKIWVDETYSTLRTIKLKKVWMTDCKNGSTDIKAKSNISLVLNANNNGTSPINESSINYTNDGNSAAMDTLQKAMFVSEKKEGITLSGDFRNPTNIQAGYMVPLTSMTDFTLVTRYDVYDTKGNLIRMDQYAANKINISRLFPTIPSLQRGKRYILKLKVKPTYLYVLSEPDLDNPTVEVVGSGN